jgi:ribonuclease PH
MGGRLAARGDGRKPDELRKVRIRTGYLKHAEGSALIEAGETRIICAVSLEERVPPFLRGSGKGWVTAEYSLLPRSTHTRTPREGLRGKVSGRTQEIQRLIGRSLRAVVDLKALGERSFIVDCDVVQADGGTRTLAITGSYVALYDTLDKLVRAGALPKLPMRDFVAATSVGIVGGQMLLDLCYAEDSSAEVDFNVVMTGKGKFVEVQGTGESGFFSKSQMDAMIALARKGILELISAQRKTLRVG